jgi:6-phosphofructokinase 2
MQQIQPKPDLVIASGSVPPGVQNSVYYDIIVEASRFGVRSMLDSEGEWLREGLAAKPYLIKPNVREAEELLGVELTSETAIIQAALNLVEKGIKVVAISRGENGIIAATKGKVLKAVPPMVKVKSTVGAGDCTIAGLALKLAYGEPLVNACRLAVAMGTAAVLTPGTELCHRADTEKLLPQIKLQQITTKQLERGKTFD